MNLDLKRKITASILTYVNTVLQDMQASDLDFERCVMYLTGMANIRDVIPFPRTVNNCEL